MKKIFSAVLLTLIFCASSNTFCQEPRYIPKNRSAKNISHASILTRKDKLFFFFATDGKLSVPPGSPSKFVQAYIMTPDKRKIKGPKIDVTNPVRAFQITVHPPILLGTYTVVIENLSVPGATRNFIKTDVLVKNSLNTNQSIISVSSTLPVPANPGDTIQGYFFPFHTFVDD